MGITIILTHVFVNSKPVADVLTFSSTSDYSVEHIYTLIVYVNDLVLVQVPTSSLFDTENNFVLTNPVWTNENEQ